MHTWPGFFVHSGHYLRRRFRLSHRQLDLHHGRLLTRTALSDRGSHDSHICYHPDIVRNLHYPPEYTYLLCPVAPTRLRFAGC